MKFIENNGTEVDKVKADEILCKFVTSRKWAVKMSSKRRDQNYDDVPDDVSNFPGKCRRGSGAAAVL